MHAVGLERWELLGATVWAIVRERCVCCVSVRGLWQKGAELAQWLKLKRD